MKREAPPLLLAAAILLWGQQTGLWWIAGLGAAVIEIPRFLRRRELSAGDFKRITYLCTALVVGAAVLAFATRPLGIARAATVEWFPIACRRANEGTTCDLVHWLINSHARRHGPLKFRIVPAEPSKN